MISLQNLLQWLTHKDHGAFDENSDRNAAARAAAHARVVARDRAAQLVRDDWIANAKANQIGIRMCLGIRFHLLGYCREQIITGKLEKIVVKVKHIT